MSLRTALGPSRQVCPTGHHSWTLMCCGLEGSAGEHHGLGGWRVDSPSLQAWSPVSLLPFPPSGENIWLGLPEPSLWNPSIGSLPHGRSQPSVPSVPSQPSPLNPLSWHPALRASCPWGAGCRAGISEARAGPVFGVHVALGWEAGIERHLTPVTPTLWTSASCVRFVGDRREGTPTLWTSTSCVRFVGDFREGTHTLWTSASCVRFVGDCREGSGGDVAAPAWRECRGDWWGSTLGGARLRFLHGFLLLGLAESRPCRCVPLAHDGNCPGLCPRGPELRNPTGRLCIPPGRMGDGTRGWGTVPAVGSGGAAPGLVGTAATLGAAPLFWDLGRHWSRPHC
nr:uncharacterized protein LOC129022409 [Pongo pygmaeus]XP_054324518.1 uncharacterized protein LOC129022409 [Pongo pygmaeus]XP_054324519.1 uncharacterized protein LOC129022409 [Pongo pygmaeus]XP_054324520.1 uncharacterized protein LOC129022409 [Pongo pygmaeus]